MSERNLLEGLVGPTTQTIDSVKALAKFLGMKEELPETITLAKIARLTLSSKKDCYYYASDKGCTCKAGTYGRICRHIRDLCEASREAQKATEPHGQSLGETLRQADANLSKMPANYQRMVRMARDEAEVVEEPILESQCSEAICKPVSEEERAAKDRQRAGRGRAHRADPQRRIQAVLTRGGLIMTTGVKVLTLIVALQLINTTMLAGIFYIGGWW
ncbi:Uncharacterised protein [uncultured archaeon]|nr:Uncharacterised protein [uncultured archaeon]